MNLFHLFSYPRLAAVTTSSFLAMVLVNAFYSVPALSEMFPPVVVIVVEISSVLLFTGLVVAYLLVVAVSRTA